MADTEAVVFSNSVKNPIPGGLLIVIEGIDGAGKTTQSNLLGEYFSERGLQCHISEEPLARQFSPSHDSMTEPQAIVILQRSQASIVSGESNMNHCPDIHIVLDVPAPVALARMIDRTQRKSTMRENAATHSIDAMRRAREFFHRRANSDDEVHMFDSFGTAAEINERILKAVIRRAVKKIAQRQPMTAESVNDVIELIGDNEDEIRGLWPELDTVLSTRMVSRRPDDSDYPELFLLPS